MSDIAAHLRDEVESIARRIFTLEVNTIVRDGILGQKMDSVDYALIDIAGWYDAKLAGLGAPAAHGVDTGGPTAFAELHERAKARFDEMSMLPPPRPPTLESDLLMLCRIREKTTQVKDVFKAYKARTGEDYVDRTNEEIASARIATAFLPSEVMLLRKIWEIGTEDIAVQTIVQLDGDVMTRIVPRFAGDDSRTLLEVHSSGVATSVAFWSRLVEAMASLLRGLGSIALGR